MVVLGSGSQRQVEDYHLSRFACCLIARNGESRKSELSVGRGFPAISLENRRPGKSHIYQ